MNEVRQILEELKSIYKRQKISYAKVAESLSMSEANVKRVMNSDDISFLKLCRFAELADLDVMDLIASIKNNRAFEDFELSEDQELMLINDHALFKVFWLLLFERVSVKDARARSADISDASWRNILKTLEAWKLIRRETGDRLSRISLQLVRLRSDGQFSVTLKKRFLEYLIEHFSKNLQGSGSMVMLRLSKDDRKSFWTISIA